jgi:hypothetical protein
MERRKTGGVSNLINKYYLLFIDLKNNTQSEITLTRFKKTVEFFLENNRYCLST